MAMLASSDSIVIKQQQQQQLFYGPLTETSKGEPVPEETVTHLHLS